MRAIKFRVWTGLEMEYKILAGALGVFYAPGLDREDQASISPFNTIYKGATPVMQFTGLKDRNGVEIYEGDIIKHGNTVLEVKPIIPISRLHSFYEVPTEDDWFSWSNVDWEVIGNIYQHPELIKEPTV